MSPRLAAPQAASQTGQAKTDTSNIGNGFQRFQRKSPEILTGDSRSRRAGRFPPRGHERDDMPAVRATLHTRNEAGSRTPWTFLAGTGSRTCSGKNRPIPRRISRSSSTVAPMIPKPRNRLDAHGLDRHRRGWRSRTRFDIARDPRRVRASRYPGHMGPGQPRDHRAGRAGRSHGREGQLGSTAPSSSAQCT